MSNRNELIRRLLFGLTDSELEDVVRVREEARGRISSPRRQREARRPIRTPRRNVRQLIQYFDNKK